MKLEVTIKKIALLLVVCCCTYAPSSLLAAEADQKAAAEKKMPSVPEDKAKQGTSIKSLTASGGNEALKDKAFGRLMDKALPLDPDHIYTLRQRLDETQRAASMPPTTPPKPVSSSIVVNLSPGVTPPVIRLASGYVSSLVFVDATGSAWPITSFSLGNSEHFNIQWDSETNVLFLQSTRNYAAGNLAVRLKDLNTPVMLSIITEQREVDYRVDIQVLGRGPNASTPIVQNVSSSSALNATLLNILDGIPPKNSVALTVNGDTGQAWLYNEKLYYRTKLTLLSPVWNAIMSSPDGTRVYELVKSPLLLATKDGETIKIHLTGF